MGRCKYNNIFTLLTLVDFITYFITKYPLYIKRSLAITKHWVNTITDSVEWTGRIWQVGSFFCCFSTDVHMYIHLHSSLPLRYSFVLPAYCDSICIGVYILVSS